MIRVGGRGVTSAVGDVVTVANVFNGPVGAPGMAAVTDAIGMWRGCVRLIFIKLV